MNARPTIRFLLLLAMACAPVTLFANSTFTWKGDNNNNWGNSANWNQDPGAGDIPSAVDTVLFQTTKVNNDRYRLDLNGETRPVGEVRIVWDNNSELGPNGYAFEFSQGVMDVHSNFFFSNEDTGDYVDVSGDINFDANTEWRQINGFPTDMRLYGTLSGSGIINLTAGEITFYGTNTFDGSINCITNNRASDPLGINIGYGDALANVRLIMGETRQTNVGGSVASHLSILGSSAHVGMLEGNLVIPIQSGKTLIVGKDGVSGTYSGEFRNVGNLIKTNTGTWTLTGPNKHQGTTTVAGGTLRLDNLGALTNSAVVVSSGATLSLLSDSCVAALSGAGSLVIGGHDLLFVKTNSPGAFSGSMQGTATIRIVGGGTFQPSGTAGPYLGSIVVDNGTLTPGATRMQSGSVFVNTSNGTLNITAATAIGTLGGTNGNIQLGGNLSFGALDDDAYFSGDMTGTGTLTKNGTGAWYSDGYNESSGASTFNGGTLGGTGRFVAAVTVNGSAVLNPGDGVQAMRFGQNLDLNGTLGIGIEGALSSRMDVDGQLDLTGSTLDVDAFGAGATENAYILSSYDTLVGQFATTSGVPAGYYLKYNYNDGVSSRHVALVKAPIVSSIVPTKSSYTDLEDPVFTVTFSEPVMGFADIGDLVVQTVSGSVSVTGADIVAATASNDVYTVTLQAVGDAGITLSVSLSGGVQDLDGDPLLASVTSSVVTLRTTPIHYASMTGSNTWPYDSWATAATNLQDVLPLIAGGGEVHVAAGTYYPDRGSSETQGDRAATFAIGDGMIVRGGYPAAGGDTQDAVANQTALLGDLNSDDGSNFVNDAENSYHVVTLSGSNAVLDSFYVEAGNADTFAGQHLHGGGIRILAGATPYVRNCSIGYNEAGNGGAGVYVAEGADAKFDGCVLENNEAGYAGGGLYAAGTVGMTNCVFVGNEAAHSGGGAQIDDYAVLSNVLIGGNKAEQGGGLYVGIGAQAGIGNLTAAGNSAAVSGGGVAQDVDSTIFLVNSVIAGNGTAGDTNSTLASLYQYTPNTYVTLFSLVEHYAAAGFGDLDGTSVSNLFVDAVDPALAPTTAGNYTPATNSILIDAGTSGGNATTNDVLGNPRFVDGDGVGGAIIDIGAIEKQ